MTFSEHLKKGLEKARAAATANARIDAVLLQFRQELSSTTGLTQQKGLRSDRAGAPALAPHRQLTPSWSAETDEFILSSGGARSLVCMLTRSTDGFPVELVYADQVVWCRTEEDLRAALGDMLENAKIAAMLQPQALAAAGA